MSLVPQPIVSKLCLRFAKFGRSRYYSHHDLLRAFERAGRRCGLPLRLSAGFNPRPRLVFLHALEVGVESTCEMVEIEFARRVNAARVRDDLARELSPVVTVLDARVLPPRRRSRQVAACVYEIGDWPDRLAAEAAARRLRGAAAAASCTGVTETGVADDCKSLAAWFDGARVEGGKLVLQLRHTQRGAGRVGEVLRWLRAHGAADVSLQARKVAMHLRDDAQERSKEIRN